MKQPEFKDLRDRLLKSASDFYGKLGGLLEKESDPKSYRALLNARYEVAQLAESVGKKEQALHIFREVLSAREELAARPGAGSDAKRDLSRSLAAVADILRETGNLAEAETLLQRSLNVAEELAGEIRDNVQDQHDLANCQIRLGHLFADTGRLEDAEREYGLALAIRQSLVATSPVRRRNT